MEANIKVVAEGNGEIDLFGMYVGTLENGEVALVHSSGNPTYAVEVATSAPTKRNVSARFASFTKVVLTLDLGARRASFAVGDEESGSLPLPAGFGDGGGVPLVFLGAKYASDVQKAWTVYFDDLKVTVTR